MVRRTMVMAVAAILWAGTAARAAEPPTLYLVGEARTTDPGGVHLGSAVYLIERKVIPSESRVEITTVALQDKKVRTHKTLMQVDGNKYTVTDPEGTYHGTGEWFGAAPWQWERWTYQARFVDGSGGIEGEDKLTDKNLHMTKRYLSQEGHLRYTVTADFSFIRATAYEILTRKLLTP